MKRQNLRDIQVEADRIAVSIILDIKDHPLHDEDRNILCGEVVIHLLAKLGFINEWTAQELEEITTGLLATVRKRMAAYKMQCDKSEYLLQGGRIQ